MLPATKLCLFIPDIHDSGNRCLIAAGPITHQPATVVYRWIITFNDNMYVIWRQVFDKMPVYGGPKVGYHYEDGKYFHERSFSKCLEAFGQRLTRDADYMGSLYRDEPTEE